MKKLLLVLSLMAVCQITHGQERQKERIKAYKTGYITQALDLTSAEAEKFWPVYNDYERRIFELRLDKKRNERLKFNALDRNESISETEAKQVLQEFFTSGEKIEDTRKEMYAELSKILTPEKLLRLYKAELDFNKHLLSEFRKRGGMNRNPPDR